MNWWTNFVRGIRALSRKDIAEREMDEELQGFLDASTREKMRSGISEDEAARAARVEMGSPNAVKHHIRSAGWESAVEILLQDLRYSLRVLARSPGFTLVAVLSLALGIGANTAIFTLINGLLLKELPVHAPRELVSFGKAFGAGVIGGVDLGTNDLFPYEFGRQLEHDPGPFQGVCYFASFTRQLSVHLSGNEQGPAAQVVTHLVSGNYFNVLGADMEMGRPILPSDADASGRSAVVVLSDHYWRQALAADPNVIGRTISISGTPFTVIGVAEKKFYGIKLQKDPPELWVPITMQSVVLMQPTMLDAKGLYWLHIIGRRDANHTMAQEQQWVNAQMRNYTTTQEGAQITPERRKEIERIGVNLISARTGISDLRTIYGDSLRILMTIVGLVLLVACANLANFLLAKAAAREREIATRLALGSSRTRIVRQVLTEALLLAFAGGALGLVLAFAATRILIRVVMSDAAFTTLNATPDLQVLAFTFGVSLFTGLLFGIAPALRASRFKATPAMNATARTAGASGGGTRILSRILVAAQVALSVVLLAGAGLFLRTLVNLQHEDMGFNRTHLLLVELTGKFGGAYEPNQLSSLYQTITDRIQALPGSRSVAFAGTPPLSPGNWGTTMKVDGYVPQPKEDLSSLITQVSSGYFATVDMPVLEGRAIDSRDVPGSLQAVVVNRTFATHFFPHGGAVGHRIVVEDPSLTGKWEIVGVVADARYNSPRETPQRMIYLPVLQLTGDNAYARWLQIKTAGDPARAAGAVRAAIAEVDPNLPILNIRTIGEQVDLFTVNEQLISELSVIFSALTVILAAIGLYGVMSYSVLRRTHEIGIRIALGASNGTVLWMVLRESLALLGIGLAVGLPAALAAARLVQSQLFGLSAFDPVTMIFAVTVIAAVTLVAAWLPARKAAAVDPLVALRCE
jgi:predicted permease